MGYFFGMLVSLFELGQPAVDVLGADVERPQLDVGVFPVADPSQLNRVVGITAQRHHELIAFGSQVSGTGQLFCGDQEPRDLVAIKLLEFGSSVVVEGFKIIGQPRKLVPVGLVGVLLISPGVVPLEPAVEFVRLVEIRVGFPGLEKAPGTQGEPFDRLPVKRESGEHGAIQGIRATAAHGQQDASSVQGLSPRFLT
jgi:hypothetical protein